MRLRLLTRNVMAVAVAVAVAWLAIGIALLVVTLAFDHGLPCVENVPPSFVVTDLGCVRWASTPDTLPWIFLTVITMCFVPLVIFPLVFLKVMAMESMQGHMNAAADVLTDPSASDWLRDALRSALERDPVDAANDAEALARVLRERCDRMLGH